MHSYGHFSSVIVNQPCMASALPCYNKTLFLEEFEQFFGCNLRQFGHYAERIAFAGRVTWDFVTRAFSVSIGIVSPSCARLSR